MTERERHRNEERTVKCPVEGCDAEKLARGIHLHVRQSSGDGHGPQGDVPDGIDFEDLETVGAETVEMDYPAERDTEQVARLCPYCGTTFTGRQGVLIHLGQVAGRKNHPEDAVDRHDPEDFPRVVVDERENVVDVVEDVPGTSSSQDTDDEDVHTVIAHLLAEGRVEEAGYVRALLMSE